jgi:hypothetical protein
VSLTARSAGWLGADERRTNLVIQTDPLTVKYDGGSSGLKTISSSSFVGASAFAETEDLSGGCCCCALVTNDKATTRITASQRGFFMV